MPKRLARLPAKCRGNNKQRMNNYMIQVVTCTDDLEEATLGDETAEEDFEDQVRMDYVLSV